MVAMTNETIGAVHGRTHYTVEQEVTTRPDVAEFIMAFTVGAAVGAAATLLLRPAPRRGMARIRKDLEPYRKQVRQNTRVARENLAASADAASHAADAIGKAGRLLINDLREEVAEIFSNASDNLSYAVNEQVGQAMKTLRRGARRKKLH
jgi:gas vesicle protein